MQEIKGMVADLERTLLSLDKTASKRVVQRALEYGSPIEIASELITETLERIGTGWEQGDYSLSQVYMSGTICEAIIDDVLPKNSPSRRNQPITAIGVFEDYHMLGKRIVYSALRASGIELIDLGGGLTIEKTLKQIEENQVKILLLSVLMLPSALKIKGLIDELKGKDVKVVVGGAPFRFDPNLATEIGAIASGKDSSEAIAIMNKLLEEAE
jgi:monomethylamine corrinoid protein